jgi:hypothetical protein
MTEEPTLDEKYTRGYWLDKEYDIIYEISSLNSSGITSPSDKSIRLTPVDNGANEVNISVKRWERIKTSFRSVDEEIVDNPEYYVEESINVLARNDKDELTEFSPTSASMLRACLRRVEVNKSQDDT